MTGLKKYLIVISGCITPGNRKLADVRAIDLLEGGILGGIRATAVVAPRGVILAAEQAGQREDQELGAHYWRLKLFNTVNGSLSSVKPTNAKHISSVVFSPKLTATIGLLGFLGLLAVLSNVHVTRTLE